MDILFSCRVCHSPLIAAHLHRGAVIDCPNCRSCQSIPTDPKIGSDPELFLEELFLFGDVGADGLRLPTPVVRRVRLRRNEGGEIIRAQEFLSDEIARDDAASEARLAEVEAENARLQQDLTERNEQLAEWQTCHDSVERELKKADQRAASLQAKINAMGNDLAQARHDLAKARGDAEAVRKANEALNHQLQAILRANHAHPPKIEPAAAKTENRKSGGKLPGEMAA